MNSLEEGEMDRRLTLLEPLADEDEEEDAAVESAAQSEQVSCYIVYYIHCIVLYSIHCIVLYSIHCIVLYSIHCIVLYSILYTLYSVI